MKLYSQIDLVRLIEGTWTWNHHPDRSNWDWDWDLACPIYSRINDEHNKPIFIKAYAST